MSIKRTLTALVAGAAIAATAACGGPSEVTATSPTTSDITTPASTTASATPTQPSPTPITTTASPTTSASTSATANSPFPDPGDDGRRGNHSVPDAVFNKLAPRLRAAGYTRIDNHGYVTSMGDGVGVHVGNGPQVNDCFTVLVPNGTEGDWDYPSATPGKWPTNLTAAFIVANFNKADYGMCTVASNAPAMSYPAAKGASATSTASSNADSSPTAVSSDTMVKQLTAAGFTNVTQDKTDPTVYYAILGTTGKRMCNVKFIATGGGNYYVWSSDPSQMFNNVTAATLLAGTYAECKS